VSAPIDQDCGVPHLVLRACPDGLYEPGSYPGANDQEGAMRALDAEGDTATPATTLLICYDRSIGARHAIEQAGALGRRNGSGM
jgi:hypothetical protein